MCVLDTISANREAVNRLVKSFNGESAYVFGSCARKQETVDSDVDFLVRFNRKASLFDMAALKLSLEKLLSRKVDLVSAATLKDDAFSRRVLSERIRL